MTAKDLMAFLKRVWIEKYGKLGIPNEPEKRKKDL